LEFCNKCHANDHRSARASHLVTSITIASLLALPRPTNGQPKKKKPRGEKYTGLLSCNQVLEELTSKQKEKEEKEKEEEEKQKEKEEKKKQRELEKAIDGAKFVCP
jgi:hypothetical protein